MRSRVLLTMLGILFFIGSALAQTRTIIGKITDAAGAPVPNASVRVKGTNIGTTTGADGSFTIAVPANGRILVVSSVGFTDQEITLGAQNTVTTVLQPSNNSLDELVVVGYQTRRKRDEAGAISTVRAADIENRPVASLDRAIQGKAAGVLVQANNGIPGGAINVQIRGAGSFNASNQPLYIVDGVQLNNRNDANFTQSNPLAFLNPNDIESIDILKDAATAAIYGATASNGVVIITTKKGRVGKTRFTFNTYQGVASPLKKLDVTNAQEFYQLRAEAYGNAFRQAPTDLAIKRTVLTEFRIPNAGTLTDAQADAAIAGLQTYDWQDAAFRNGTVQNYDVAASGGTDRTTFRVSANYNKQAAIVTKADFDRAALNFNLTNRATDKLSINTGLNLSTFNQNLPFAVEGSFLGNPAFSAAGILPFNRIYNDDGSFFGLPGNPGPDKNLAGVLNQNIIAVNELNSGYQRTNQAVGNLSAEYRLMPWLTFRSFYALDYRLVQGKSFRDPRTADAFARKGLGQVQSNWNTNFLTNQLLLVNHDFNERNHVDGTLGYEYRKENNEGISASGDGFPTPQFTTLNTAANPLGVGEFFTGFRRQSVFAAVNYSFDGRYIIGATARYDGSSRFGANNRYGFFPGLKVAWNIDNEAFMQDASTISTLRLRAGVGRVGNDQIGNFDALGLYGGGPVYGGNAGISYSQLSNPELRWETNTSANIGVDFGFFANRLNGSVEVYDKTTTDLLFSQPVSQVSGFSSITRNVGEFNNRGIELTVSGNPIKARQPRAFNWTSTFVMGYNKNKVVALPNGAQVLPGNDAIRVGEPLNVVFTQRYAGVNPATGRPMWYDINGNITYQPTLADRVNIGDQTPEWSGGLTNVFSLAGFTLDVFFQYEYGRLVSDGQVNFLSENLGRINFLQTIYDNRWTTPGQITSVPRMNAAGAEQQGSGANTGSRSWRKADYIRLKNVQLSYDLPATIIQRLRINSAQFYIQGTNLYTYADVPSYDVEFLGAGTGIIPQSKNFTLGLQLGF